MTSKNWKHGEGGRGGRRSKEWRAWIGMINRCTYPSVERYPRYGGRGISVCERWLNSFESFLADMGRAPSADHQLDRRDNDGNYEPDNCQWATRSEQVRNSTKARKITAHGRTMTLGDWAKETGLNRQTIQMRIDTYGWSIDRALSEPLVRKRRGFQK